MNRSAELSERLDRVAKDLAAALALFEVAMERATAIAREAEEGLRRLTGDGRPDSQPVDGGEFFGARGIGADSTPGCFVCGGAEGLYTNVAGFVQGKAAGERVVAMFRTGARLDYREYEPDRVQVKVGACEQHVEQLRTLRQATLAEGRITPTMIDSAINVAEPRRS